MPGTAMNIEKTESAATASNPVMPVTRSMRHRITFSTEKTLAFVSVLELTSIWERSLRRAGIPLRYSQGFNPRPRMNVAAPLPVGCGAAMDLMDIWLEKTLDAEDIDYALKNKTPADLKVVDVTAVSPDEPALAERLVSAEYTVWLQELSQQDLAQKIQDLLAEDMLLRPRRGRKYRGKTYDLRPLILDLHITPDTQNPGLKVWMHLKARPGATGRPDEVLKAMGIKDHLYRCTRTRLIFSS
jgi:radical SAM-linked protein